MPNSQESVSETPQKKPYEEKIDSMASFGRNASLEKIKDTLENMNAYKERIEDANEFPSGEKFLAVADYGTSQDQKEVADATVKKAWHGNSETRGKRAGSLKEYDSAREFGAELAEGEYRLSACQIIETKKTLTGEKENKIQEALFCTEINGVSIFRQVSMDKNGNPDFNTGFTFIGSSEMLNELKHKDQKSLTKTEKQILLLISGKTSIDNQVKAFKKNVGEEPLKYQAKQDEEKKQDIMKYTRVQDIIPNMIENLENDYFVMLRYLNRKITDVEKEAKLKEERLRKKITNEPEQTMPENVGSTNETLDSAVIRSFMAEYISLKSRGIAFAENIKLILKGLGVSDEDFDKFTNELRIKVDKKHGSRN